MGKKRDEAKEEEKKNTKPKTIFIDGIFPAV
jgi:hypothetical protein